MPYSIHVSPFSFIQFAESDVIQACNWPGHDMCLPVYDVNDAWFQFSITGDTEEETDALCTIDNENMAIGLVEQCTDGFLIEFTQKPIRYRVGALRVVYAWQHGMPGFDSVLDIGECFRFKIQLAEQAWCSNCLQRIGNDCHTSVIQFSNNDNAFGYYYCAGGNDADNGDITDCEPVELQFINQATMTIPWTAYLNDKFGPLPSIEVWVYDPVTEELIKPGIVAKLDTYPPTEIRLDFGGISSGIVKIM